MAKTNQTPEERYTTNQLLQATAPEADVRVQTGTIESQDGEVVVPTYKDITPEEFFHLLLYRLLRVRVFQDSIPVMDEVKPNTKIRKARKTQSRSKRKK